MTKHLFPALQFIGCLLVLYGMVELYKAGGMLSNPITLGFVGTAIYMICERTKPTKDDRSD